MNRYRSIPRRYTIALRFRSDFWEHRIISADIFKISVDPSKPPSSSFFSFFFPLLQSSVRSSDEHGQLLRHGYGGHLLLHVLRFSSSLLISFPHRCSCCFVSQAIAKALSPKLFTITGNRLELESKTSRRRTQYHSVTQQTSQFVQLGCRSFEVRTSSPLLLEELASSRLQC